MHHHACSAEFWVSLHLSPHLSPHTAPPQMALLGALYLVYVATTVAMSRDQEPLHSDPRRHEVPMFR